MPKASGPCKASIPQWHFNTVTRRCEKFYYGGCEGNANRFNDRESCEARCLGSFVYSSDGLSRHPNGDIVDSGYVGPGLVLPTNVLLSHDPCLDGPKDEGQCQYRTEYAERWYFNVEERSCHRMYYSGCGGNRNNFYTYDECYIR